MPDNVPGAIAALFNDVPGASPTFARRLFSRIDASGDCWEWTGYRNPDGYGCVDLGPHGTRHLLVHRAVWEMLVGPIPSDLVFDHLCRNRGCANPDHGELVTDYENKRRGFSSAMLRARQTVCSNGGHPLVPRPGKNGEAFRYCPTCNRMASKARRDAQRVISAAQVEPEVIALFNDPTEEQAV